MFAQSFRSVIKALPRPQVIGGKVNVSSAARTSKINYYGPFVATELCNLSLNRATDCTYGSLKKD